MGVYDTLIDGERQAQIKCFTNEFKTYKVGDKVPRKGTYIIILPAHENVKFALISEGIFVCLSDCPPTLIDKWGEHLRSPADFKDRFEELVQKTSKEMKKESEA